MKVIVAEKGGAGRKTPGEEKWRQRWQKPKYGYYIILEGARASTGLSLLCVDVGYKHWSNGRPLCA